MRFNKQELIALASQTSQNFDREGVLIFTERQDGFFRRSVGCSVRWFRLRGNLLFYLKGPEPWYEPTGVIVLGNHQVSVQIQDENGHWPFQIVWENGVCYRIATFHESERVLWLKAIENAPYEQYSKKIADLQKQLNETRPMIDIMQFRIRNRIINDINAVPICEMALSCDNLLCDAQGNPPSTFLSIFVLLPDGQVVKYGCTECVELCSNPTFSRTIQFRASDHIRTETMVRIAVCDVKEAVSHTSVSMGSATLKLNVIQEAQRLRIPLVGHGDKTVGFLTINGWTLEPFLVGSPTHKAVESDMGEGAKSMPVRLGLKLMYPQYSELICFNLLNPYHVTYRFQSGLGGDIKVHEVMAEPRFCYNIPIQTLELFMQREKELLEILLPMTDMPHRIQNRRTEIINVHMALMKLYSACQKSMFAMAGCYKPSCRKEELDLGFVPINLHLQRMWVNNDTLNKTGFHDVVTVGAFAAHSQFNEKDGGLIRLLQQLKDSYSGKEEMAANADRVNAELEKIASVKDMRNAAVVNMDKTLVAIRAGNYDMAAIYNDGTVTNVKKILSLWDGPAVSEAMTKIGWCSESRSQIVQNEVEADNAAPPTENPDPDASGANSGGASSTLPEGFLEVSGASGADNAGASSNILKSSSEVTGVLSADNAVEVAGALGADNADEVAGALGADNAVEVAGALGADNADEVAGALGADNAVEVAGALGADKADEVAGALGADKADEVAGALGADKADEVAGDLGADNAVEEASALGADKADEVAGALGADNAVEVAGALGADNADEVAGSLGADKADEVAGALGADNAVEEAGALGADNADEVAGALGADKADKVAGALGADNADEVAGALGADKADEVAGALGADKADEVAGALGADKADEVAGALGADKADEEAGALGADNADEVAGALGADNADEVAGALGADNAGEVAGALGADNAGEVAGALGADNAGEVAGALGADNADEVAGASWSLPETSWEEAGAWGGDNAGASSKPSPGSSKLAGTSKADYAGASWSLPETSWEAGGAWGADNARASSTLSEDSWEVAGASNADYAGASWSLPETSWEVAGASNADNAGATSALPEGSWEAVDVLDMANAATSASQSKFSSEVAGAWNVFKAGAFNVVDADEWKETGTMDYAGAIPDLAEPRATSSSSSRGTTPTADLAATFSASVPDMQNEDTELQFHLDHFKSERDEQQSVKSNRSQHFRQKNRKNGRKDRNNRNHSFRNARGSKTKQNAGHSSERHGSLKNDSKSSTSSGQISFKNLIRIKKEEKKKIKKAMRDAQYEQRLEIDPAIKGRNEVFYNKFTLSVEEAIFSLDNKINAVTAKGSMDVEEFDAIKVAMEHMIQQLDSLSKSMRLMQAAIRLDSELASWTSEYATLQIRRDTCFVQALTTLITGLFSWLNTVSEDIIYKLITSGVGPLCEFEGLLSLYGTERTMWGDMVIAIEDLQTVSFTLGKITPGAFRMPQVGGRRGDVVVEIPVSDSLYDRFDTKKDYPTFRVTTVFFNVGINEKASVAEALAETRPQHYSNNDNLEKLAKYYDKYNKVIPNEPLESMKGASRNEAIEEAIEFLRRTMLTRQTKNVDILHQAALAARLMNGIRFTSCKSAKDRTGMAVTLEQVNILSSEYHLADHERKKALNVMRSHGCRRQNTTKNIGINKYAFTKKQVSSLPKDYRPPNGSYGVSFT